MNHISHSIAYGLARDAFVDLVGRLTAAWNAGDATAYGANFTDDCDYVAFDGTHLRGRAQNISLHQRLFDTVLRGSHLEFEYDIDVRLLADGLALVHAKGSVRMPWQATLPAERRSIQTYMMVRQPDAWRIAAFHNARIRPMTLPGGWALRVVLAAMRLRTALSGQSMSTSASAANDHSIGIR
jgi:uncharacterized protein (TIGR02246 family)